MVFYCVLEKFGIDRFWDYRTFIVDFYVLMLLHSQISINDLFLNVFRRIFSKTFLIRYDESVFQSAYILESLKCVNKDRRLKKAVLQMV